MTNKIIYAYVLEELGYSKLKVVCFNKLNSTPVIRIVVVRGKMRKKFKSSSLRIRPKNYVTLNFFAENVEPYFVEKKLTSEEIEQLGKEFDLQKIELFYD